MGEEFVHCSEKSDEETRLNYWKERLQQLLAKPIPPWLECQEALRHIKELEGENDA